MVCIYNIACKCTLCQLFFSFFSCICAFIRFYSYFFTILFRRCGAGKSQQKQEGRRWHCKKRFCVLFWKHFSILSQKKLSFCNDPTAISPYLASPGIILYFCLKRRSRWVESANPVCSAMRSTGRSVSFWIYEHFWEKIHWILNFSLEPLSVVCAAMWHFVWHFFSDKEADAKLSW